MYQIQRFDFDSNLVVARKLIVGIPDTAGLRRKKSSILKSKLRTRVQPQSGPAGRPGPDGNRLILDGAV